MKLNKLFARQIIAISLGAGLALFSFQSAYALDRPSQSKADHRVRYANYNPADVIQLDAVIGVATHIVLEEGENYSFHVFGDSEAYEFTYKDNHLFFKPTAEDANTNLIVVTDKRDYAFKLNYSPNRDSRALYKLQLRYPETEAKIRASQAKKKAIEQSLMAAGTPINWESYTRSGDASIAPVHAWDDGRQTWLQFPYEADLPTAYRVTPDDNEVIVNYHMADARTMVLHRTAKKWHLRLGNLVVAIYNGNYGLTPAPTHTGTASPVVKRVVKGVPEQQLPKPLFDSTTTVLESIDIEPATQLATTSAYKYQGDSALEPIRVWEDGGYTLIEFPPQTQIPEIYAIDSHNKLTIIETSQIKENIISLPGISNSWLLRRNGAVLTVTKDIGI